MELSRTLRALNNPPTIRSTETAVLLCPPLDFWRFIAHRFISPQGVDLVEHARLLDLRNVFTNGARLVFLVAHHIARSDCIEFFDGPIQWTELRSLIPNNVAFVSFVCHSGHWAEDLRDGRGAGPVGGASHLMSLSHVLIFLDYWLAELDSADFFKARDAAMSKYLSRPFDPREVILDDARSSTRSG